MRFILSTEGENLTALANRLFCLKGKQDTTEARRRLLELNPHLPDRKNIPPGTVVFVPKELDGEEPREGRTFGEVLDGALEQFLTHFAQVEEDLGAQASAETERQAEVQKVLADPQLRRAARETPEVGERVAQLGEALAGRQKRSQELEQFRKQAAGEIREDLAALAKVAGSVTE